MESKKIHSYVCVLIRSRNPLNQGTVKYKQWRWLGYLEPGETKPTSKGLCTFPCGRPLWVKRTSTLVGVTAWYNLLVTKRQKQSKSISSCFPKRIRKHSDKQMRNPRREDTSFSSSLCCPFVGWVWQVYYRLQIFSSVQHCGVVRSNTNAICYLLVECAVEKLVLQDEASLSRLQPVPRGCPYPFPLSQEYAIAILHEIFLTQATNLVTSFIPFVQTKSRCWERVQACVLHLGEATCLNPLLSTAVIHSVCTLLSERDPEYRAEYRVTRIMGDFSLFRKEFYEKSQIWEERDRAEEGQTTLSTKMPEGNREVRGFKAI